jgi:hypothetical protein
MRDFEPDSVYMFIIAEKGRVVRAKGVEEKEKVYTSKCKSLLRLDETALWALNYGSEGGRR